MIKNSSRGSALIIVIGIVALVIILAGLFTKLVYSSYATAADSLTREQAFYLAEAGLEQAKVELNHNPNWYTDLPYYLEDNIQWLAYYAVGQNVSLGEGSFKLVREKGKGYLYSIGFKDQGVVILKLRFSGSPLTVQNWEEI